MANRSLSFSRRVWQILFEILLGLVFVLVLAFTSLYLLYQTRILNPLEVMDEISASKLKEVTSPSELETYLSAYHLDYVVFDEKGEITNTFLEKSQEALAKQAFLENTVVETASESYRPYQAGNHQTVVIRFSLIPEFSKREWRKNYDFNQLFSYTILILVFLATIFPFVRFLYQARKEFHILEAVPKKATVYAREPDLNDVRIREIRQSIEAIKEMETRLETLIEYEKQEKKDLIFQVSALSHDIKTPLTIIKGNVGLIEECDNPEEVSECLAYIDDGISQIEDYLDLMINYSKWIYQPDAKHTVSLNSLIAGISNQVQGYISKGTDFEIRNESERDSLYCSSSNIQRAIVNILTNAFDFAESKVSLQISDSENQLLFQIYNDGPPLDSQGLEHVGKLFYTQSQGRSASDKHYGLGLYFSRLTASLHGGSLSCQNLDKGVLFQFIIQA